MMHDFGWGMMGGWSGFGFGWLWMVLWWALIIAGIVALVRWLGASSSASSGDAATGRKALDILKERYARGELDRETYEQMRRDLERQ